MNHADNDNYIDESGIIIILIMSMIKMRVLREPF